MSGDDWLPDVEALARNQEAQSANRARAHTVANAKIQNAILSTGRVQLWDNPTGFDDRVKRPYGLGKGGADNVGQLKGPGRFFAAETKTGSGQLTEDQTRWHASVKKNGGFACVVHNEEEAIAAVARAFEFRVSKDTFGNMVIVWSHFE